MTPAIVTNGIFQKPYHTEILALPSITEFALDRSGVADVQTLQFRLLSQHPLVGIGPSRLDQIETAFARFGARSRQLGAERLYCAVFRIDRTQWNLDGMALFSQQTDTEILNFIKTNLPKAKAGIIQTRFWLQLSYHALAQKTHIHREKLREVLDSALSDLRQPDALAQFHHLVYAHQPIEPAFDPETYRAPTLAEILARDGNLTLDQLELSGRLARFLDRERLRTFGRLQDFLYTHPKGALLTYEGIGKRSALELQQKLLELGHPELAERIFP